MRAELDRIQADWSKIKKAALLAWEGQITSLKRIDIRNMPITDIPRDQMEILASIVTEEVNIHGVLT